MLSVADSTKRTAPSRPERGEYTQCVSAVSKQEARRPAPESTSVRTLSPTHPLTCVRGQMVYSLRCRTSSVAPSSSGQDRGFSALKPGFDSPWRYHRKGGLTARPCHMAGMKESMRTLSVYRPIDGHPRKTSDDCRPIR